MLKVKVSYQVVTIVQFLWHESLYEKNKTVGAENLLYGRQIGKSNVPSSEGNAWNEAIKLIV